MILFVRRLGYDTGLFFMSNGFDSQGFEGQKKQP